MAMQRVIHAGVRRRRLPGRQAAGAPAGAITLRNLPPAVDGELRRLARERGLSLNRLVVALLTDRLDKGRRAARVPAEHHDLDVLAGSWTRDDKRAFDRALDSTA